MYSLVMPCCSLSNSRHSSLQDYALLAVSFTYSSPLARTVVLVKAIQMPHSCEKDCVN